MYVVNKEQMKKIEAKAIHSFGICDFDLMKNAGNAVFTEIKNNFGDIKSKNFVVLCGFGNNGGDGFIVASLLKASGANVNILLFGNINKTTKSTHLALEQCSDIYKIFFSEENAMALVQKADFIVDAVFGTGFKGDLNREETLFFEAINTTKAKKIAVDLPSGAECDSGKAACCIKANLTVTFQFYKPCHILFPAASFCGKVIVKDIGITSQVYKDENLDICVIEEELVDKIIPIRQRDTHKGSFGKMLAICGSKFMTGAAYFSVMGAIKTGVGLVTLCVPDEILAVMQGKLNEPTFCSYTKENIEKELENIFEHLKKSNVCLIGCGLGQSSEAVFMLKKMMHTSFTPLVIDADALNVLSKEESLKGLLKPNYVLTPHLKEFSRLCGKSIEEINNDKINTVLNFAIKNNVITLLKGAYTIIATPSGKAYINRTGNSGLAKGGSGDVLAGMIASFIAQGISPENASVCSVYLHGKAADNLAGKLSEYGLTPTDVFNELPLLLNKYNGDDFY